jgi:hypothetical protein
MARSVGFKEADEANTEELSTEDLELEKHSLSLSLSLYGSTALWSLATFSVS